MLMMGFQRKKGCFRGSDVTISTSFPMVFQQVSAFSFLAEKTVPPTLLSPIMRVNRLFHDYFEWISNGFQQDFQWVPNMVYGGFDG